MPYATRAGDVLAERYRLVDLLSESGGGRFWRAHDRILERHVALHVLSADDPRAGLLMEAARRSATVLDQRILRVLDIERNDTFCFVVNEWGAGTSLDIMLASNGPLSPRRGAWLVAEVADSIADAHAHVVAHGRLVPENVLVDSAGAVKIIGFCVDAALHGLPPGTLEQDVLDLAGLLEATLTGKWAGTSQSSVPRVPTAHGRVLRPRQVRAGVPRPLDDLCDVLLNPRGQRIRDVHHVGTARGMQIVLADFVGDPAGLAEAIAAGNPDKHETVNLPAVPEILARPHADDFVEPEPEPDPVPVPDPEPEPDPTPSAPELPTQAGLPIFGDGSDDVSWLRARDEPPPPPPAFEEPPERPLFAPDPTDGEPLRKPRHARLDHGTVATRGDEYWPFDSGRGTGSGLFPAVEDTGAQGQVPGRNWLRLAALVAVGLVLVVVVAIAFNLGRGKTPLGSDPDDQTTTTPSTQTSTTSRSPAAVTPITGVTATDLDPEGDNQENPQDAGNAVDGDPQTAWTTLTYKQQFGPGGLKDGVGLVLDLGRSVDVRRVDLTLQGEPTGVSLYLTDDAPTTIDGLAAVAQLSAASHQSVTLDQKASGRYLTIWLTSLPVVPGGFKGGIVDVVVEG